MKRIPVTTELGRRDRFWPAVAASVAVHVAAIGVAVKASSLPRVELDQVPLHARLVRLGEKKPEQFLPQKEEAPPPAPAPAPPPPPAAEPPPPSPQPAPTPAPAPAAAPAPKAAARPSPTKGSAPPANTAGVSAALAKMTQEVQRERFGDPNGDVQGDSDEASEGDRYLALVQRELQRNYQLPTTIPDRDRLHLKAVIILWIEADGSISRWKVETPSGNRAFDDALERAIRKTRAPPPPDDQRAAYRDRGIQVTFTAASL